MWQDRDGYDMRAIVLTSTLAAVLMAVIGITAYVLLMMAGVMP